MFLSKDVSARVNRDESCCEDEYYFYDVDADCDLQVIRRNHGRDIE